MQDTCETCHMEVMDPCSLEEADVSTPISFLVKLLYLLQLTLAVQESLVGRPSSIPRSLKGSKAHRNTHFLPLSAQYLGK